MKPKELTRILHDLDQGNINKDDAEIKILNLHLINWKKLRQDFFDECTTPTPRSEFGKKVNMAPHDLFEWFKKNIKP